MKVDELVPDELWEEIRRVLPSLPIFLADLIIRSRSSASRLEAFTAWLLKRTPLAGTLTLHSIACARVKYFTAVTVRQTVRNMAR